MDAFVFLSRIAELLCEEISHPAATEGDAWINTVSKSGGMFTSCNYRGKMSESVSGMFSVHSASPTIDNRVPFEYR